MIATKNSSEEKRLETTHVASAATHSKQKVSLAPLMHEKQGIQLLFIPSIVGSVLPNECSWETTILKVEGNRIKVALNRPVLYEQTLSQLPKGAPAQATIRHSLDDSVITFTAKLDDIANMGDRGLWLTIPESATIETSHHDHASMIGPVKLTMAGTAPIEGTTLNISVSGLRIASPYQFSEGEMLQASFKIGFPAVDLEIPAKVLYCESARQEKNLPVNRDWFSAMLTFSALTPEQEDMIGGLCDRFYSKQLQK